MFDTYLTLIGNVLTAPEWRRTSQSNTLVAHFRVASTARRRDRQSGEWIDGNSLRVRVSCWRRLAEGVASSVMVGDPVVVVGRLYTRDWTDSEGNARVTYEMEAITVGHDLSRGKARFARTRPTGPTSAVEDSEAESRVRGETTEPVPEGEAPARFGDHPFDDLPEPDFGSAPISPAPAYDALATLRGGREFDEELAAAPVSAEADDDDTDDTDDADDLDEADDDGDSTTDGLSSDMLPGDGAEPDPGATPPGAGLTDPDGGVSETGAPGGPARGRRGRSRTPVPA